MVPDVCFGKFYDHDGDHQDSKASRMGKRKEKDLDYKPGPTHNRGRSTYEKESQSTKAQLQGII